MQLFFSVCKSLKLKLGYTFSIKSCIWLSRSGYTLLRNVLIRFRRHKVIFPSVWRELLSTLISYELSLTTDAAARGPHYSKLSKSGERFGFGAPRCIIMYIKTAREHTNLILGLSIFGPEVNLLALIISFEPRQRGLNLCARCSNTARAPFCWGALCSFMGPNDKSILRLARSASAHTIYIRPI
jgi:hypothetical protein